jgi:hypothetical protein
LGGFPPVPSTFRPPCSPTTACFLLTRLSYRLHCLHQLHCLRSLTFLHSWRPPPFSMTLSSALPDMFRLLRSAACITSLTVCLCTPVLHLALSPLHYIPGSPSLCAIGLLRGWRTRGAAPWHMLCVTGVQTRAVRGRPQGRAMTAQHPRDPAPCGPAVGRRSPSGGALRAARLAGFMALCSCCVVFYAVCPSCPLVYPVPTSGSNPRPLALLRAALLSTPSCK